MKYETALTYTAEAMPEWQFDRSRLADIGKFLDRQIAEVYPAPEAVLRCFYNKKPSDFKVIIIGQDCYHTPDVADGMAFSTKQSKIPPSLQNIFKELKDDLGIENTNPSLNSWKKQGVLLLNTFLSVERGKPGSHAKIWEGFSGKVLKILQQDELPRVYILWGKFAKDMFYENYNDFHIIKDTVLYSTHPSPFSAEKGFFGSKPFSKINTVLKQNNIPEIDWRT